MKRNLVIILAAVLVLVLIIGMVLLTGKRENPSVDTSTGSSTGSTESSEVTNSSEESSEESTEDELSAQYRHPLTGERLSQPWAGQLVAVMTNNIKYAMPQHGLSQADIVYEIQEEGDITRNMAIFSDLSKVGNIGSIRSTRTYFVSVAASFDAYLVHCGTSNHAYGGKYDSDGHKISNWKDLDQFYNGKYFERNQDRIDADYAWEHTLFTSGEMLQQALNGKEESKTYDNGFGLVFDENVELNGASAQEVTIKFKGGKTSTFIYDPATKLYKRTQYGTDSIDGNTGETTTFKNVIAIYTRQWGCNCGKGHQFYDTIGSGEGYAAINGKIVPILWSRESVDSPYVYTLEDGTPLTLDVGSTYIAVVGIKHPISYQ